MTVEQIKDETFRLIDALKSTCQQYGMGNDGNEYKVITQIFLYKFLNDKFCFEVKKLNSPIVKKINNAESFEVGYAALTEDERLDLLDLLDANIPRLKPEHLIGNLWSQQTKPTFDTIFDATMTNIADENIDIFNTHTSEETKIPIFENLTVFVTDTAKRAAFARALTDKLIKFSFEEVFSQRYDFFATIFEYLIKDYNTAGGGKYAEYYTPHSIATIMARLLVGDEKNLHNIECYDPSAGTGTLLMALAHQVGEDKCTIYSQDISQRSNKMLKLNLLLNNLVLSLDKAIQGDTLVNPYHKSDDGNSLRQFDYVVSNPPFKMDFSETREKIASQTQRFWAGVPNIPKTKKEGMAIYTCFIQHVVNSIKENGKGAIVVPTGFITAKNNTERKVLEKIINDKIVAGVVSMPSNVFATTGTNVSVIFFDKSKKADDYKVILVDASKLGEEYKDANDLKKKRLRESDIELIIDTYINKKVIDDFSVTVSYEEIVNKNYSLSAGQYFDIKIEHIEITEADFNKSMSSHKEKLDNYFNESHKLEKSISEVFGKLLLNKGDNK